jgi:predicted nicotinamide N-methyase
MTWKHYFSFDHEVKQRQPRSLFGAVAHFLLHAAAFVPPPSLPNLRYNNSTITTSGVDGTALESRIALNPPLLLFWHD